jgi:hypothetical protein
LVAATLSAFLGVLALWLAPRLAKRQCTAQFEGALTGLHCAIHGDRPSLEVRQTARRTHIKINGCCEDLIQEAKVAVEATCGIRWMGERERDEYLAMESQKASARS